MKPGKILWRSSRQAHRRRRSKRPPLRLTPYAWAKLIHLRDLGETEVGGFGVSRFGDLLLVEDVGLMVHQLSRWLRKLPVDTDLSVNLLASELAAT
jgi:hypothetical protein